MFMGTAKFSRTMANQMEKGHYFFKDTQGVTSHSITPNTLNDDIALVRQLRMERNGKGIYVPVVNADTAESAGERGTKQGRSQYVITEEREASHEAETYGESQPKEARNQPKEHNTGELAPIDEQLREEAYMIVKLLAEGKNQGEIFDLLYQAKPGANAKYVQAKERFAMAMALVATGMHRNSEEGA